MPVPVFVSETWPVLSWIVPEKAPEALPLPAVRLESVWAARLSMTPDPLSEPTLVLNPCRSSRPPLSARGAASIPARNCCPPAASHRPTACHRCTYLRRRARACPRHLGQGELPRGVLQRPREAAGGVAVAYGQVTHSGKIIDGPATADCPDAKTIAVQVQRAAGEGQRTGVRSQGRIAAHLQNAAVEQRAATIGIRARKSLRARAGLHEADDVADAVGDDARERRRWRWYCPR